jgi:nitrite reductase/ring-hydroxylating ferredoxin subunit
MEKTIALFNVGGTIFATDNTCLHQGGPLGEGELVGDVVICPWHQWEYNVRTGEIPGNSSAKVATYPVQVEGNDIKVAV